MRRGLRCRPHCGAPKRCSSARRPTKTAIRRCSDLAAAIADAPALAQVVYLSSVGVYGDRDGAWVDESSVPAPGSPRAHGGWRPSENGAHSAKRAASRVDILRLAGIYGPGRNALEKLGRGEARRIVKPGQVFNRIHVDDIASLAVRLIAAGGPGGIWNVADEEPAPSEEVIVLRG